MSTDDEKLSSALKAIERADYITARALLANLAHGGNPVAEFHYGLLYLLGLGVDKDGEEAADYLGRAAEQGHAEARYHFAHCLQGGVGVPRDPVRALAWYMLSAGERIEDSAVIRDHLIAQLETGEIRRAVNTAKRKSPGMTAGWLVDATGTGAVWAPSWYRFGLHRLELEVPLDDGLASGEGRAVVTATLPEDASRTFEGHFRNGFFMGDQPLEHNFQVLPDDAYLVELPRIDFDPSAGTGSWVMLRLQGLQLSLTPRGPLATAKIYVGAAKTAALLNDEAVKGLMIDAADIYNSLAPIDSHVNVTVLPNDLAMVFEDDRTVFRPVSAKGVVVGFEHDESRISVQNFVNIAGNLDKQRKLEEERHREEKRKAKKRARIDARIAKRKAPEVRGLTIYGSLADLRAALAEEAEEWDPPYDPERLNHPLWQLKQSIRLKDRSLVIATFTTPVSGSKVFRLEYQQNFHDGPNRDELVRSLREKYGKPDSVAGNETYHTWGFPSAVGKNSIHGAKMVAVVQLDYETGKVGHLGITINDMGLGSFDEKAAHEKIREDKRRDFERNQSDEVKF